jgi:acid phosphatase type 7
MRRLVILALGVAALASGGEALSSKAENAAQQATYGPMADAYVSSSNRRRNFGRERLLRIQGRPVMRSYIRFDVRGIEGEVARATLRVFARSGSPRGITVRPTATRWSERGITFATAPRPTGAVARSGGLRARRWASINVTRLVRGNGSVSLAVAGSGTTTLASRESGGTRPRLIVTARAPAASATLVAAGDIATCGSDGQVQTAALVDAIPGTVAALGDLAYENGTAQEFAGCYEPSWGRFKARTRPTPGNHEYHTPGAAPYFAYWGATAGPPGLGYYSYELGAWHVVVLNSNCADVSCAPGSPQEQWLRADLAAHRTTCTVAYWHHPRFSSGQVGSNSNLQAFWQVLYDARAELVLAGHAHNYQRWAPLNAARTIDRERGLRQIVVGTGGRVFHSVTPQVPEQEAVNADTFGVLRLTLKATGYDWQFVPVAGRTFTDAGSGTCR